MPILQRDPFYRRSLLDDIMGLGGLIALLAAIVMGVIFGLQQLF